MIFKRDLLGQVNHLSRICTSLRRGLDPFPLY